MKLFNPANEAVSTGQPVTSSVLCEGLTFRDGNLEGVGSLTIDCFFVGNICTDDLIIIGEAGCVNGDIEAKCVVIKGNVEGNVEAVEKIQLCEGGLLNGDIRCASLEISSNAAFSGTCNMSSSKMENNMLHKMMSKEAAETLIYQGSVQIATTEE